MANSSLVQMKESILGKKCTCDSTKYTYKVVSGDFCTVYGTNIFPPLALAFGRRISVTEGVKIPFLNYAYRVRVSITCLWVSKH